jgi:hypothetical protein
LVWRPTRLAATRVTAWHEWFGDCSPANGNQGVRSQRPIGSACQMSSPE